MLTKVPSINIYYNSNGLKSMIICYARITYHYVIVNKSSKNLYNQSMY